MNARDDLQSCVRWHNGDVWRNSEKESERVAWDQQMGMLQKSVNRIEDTLRAALAQPVEPVAWHVIRGDDVFVTNDANFVDLIKDAKITPLYTAAPAPQAQPVAAQVPVKFLAGGMRFKTAKFPGGVCITGMPHELAGRWVALVAAEDNCHLKSSQPVAQPLPQEQIHALLDDFMDSSDERLIQFARDIEKAHGIKKARGE
jgi:hypothetical protein